MKNHTVTVHYFELHQVPIGFIDMDTPQASSLGFRGWAEAGRPTGRMVEGQAVTAYCTGSEIDTKGCAHESSVNKTPV